MDHGSYTLHKLPLVDFNGRGNNLFHVSGEIKKESHEDTCKETKEKQTRKTNSLLGYLPKCAKTKSASPFFFKKRLRSPLTAVNCVSKRLFCGKTTLKSSININNIQKSSNLYDTKQKCSLYGVISDQIKQKVSNFLKFGTDKKQRKRNLKGNNKINDIKVLFEAEKLKTSKIIRKRNVLRDYRRLDLFYNSRSSSDVNGFQYNRQCTPNFCCQLLKCKSNSFLQNHKCRDYSYEHDFCYKTKTHNKNMNANKFSRACDCSTPVHYKLVDFPCNHINKCFDLKTSSSKKCNCRSPVINQQLLRINRGGRVTSSCFKCTTGAGDSAQCRHSANPKVLTNNYNIKEKKGRCRKKRVLKPKLSVHNIYFSNNYFISLLKSTLKVCLLSFAIIAWSPCIVSICVYWLITYPLRPKHIFTQAKLDACECGSCLKYGNEFWHVIFHSIVRILEKVGHAYNALCSSIKNQKTENTNILKPCLSRPPVMNRNSICKHRKLEMSANPRKRYTLYYTRRRGWIMKPKGKRHKRKNNLHKKYHSNTKTDKLLISKKNKRHPGICQIGIQGKSTALKNKPYIKIYKKIPSEGKRTNLKTYLPKMVSTRSSPLLVNTSSLMTERNVSDTLFTNICNTSNPFMKENKIFEQNYSQMHFLGDSINGNFKTNTCRKSKQKCNGILGNVFYNTQIPLRLSGQLRKSLEPSCYKYKYMGGIRKRYWTPSTCSCRRILLHNVRFPCSKIIPAKPLGQKARSKYRIISIGNQRKCKHHYKCKNLTFRQKVFNYCKTSLKRLKCMVRTTESEVWTSDICNDMFMSTLRKKPWFWVYKTCPSFYPYFLIFCKFNENVAHCLLFTISACTWCPMICCCYFCYTLFCKCLYQ